MEWTLQLSICLLVTLRHEACSYIFLLRGKAITTNSTTWANRLGQQNLPGPTSFAAQQYWPSTKFRQNSFRLPNSYSASSTPPLPVPYSRLTKHHNNDLPKQTTALFNTASKHLNLCWRRCYVNFLHLSWPCSATPAGLVAFWLLDIRIYWQRQARVRVLLLLLLAICIREHRMLQEGARLEDNQ